MAAFFLLIRVFSLSFTSFFMFSISDFFIPGSVNPNDMIFAAFSRFESVCKKFFSDILFGIWAVINFDSVLEGFSIVFSVC